MRRVQFRTGFSTKRSFPPKRRHYLCLHVGRRFGPSVVKTSRRTYLTSHAVTPGSVEKMKSAIDSGSKMIGAKQNFVMLADVGPPSNTRDYLERSSNRIIALDQLGIPNQRTTYIAVADKLMTEELRKAFKHFLKFQMQTRGPFQNILVVKGSDMQAPLLYGSGYKEALDFAFSEVCEIVQEVQTDRLALIMNLYQPFPALMSEISRKSIYMPVKYFTPPLFRLSDLPPETLLYLEEMMRLEKHKLSFGLLHASKRMYDNQLMTDLMSGRVDLKSGRDKYKLPPLKKDGSVDHSYIPEVLGWVGKHHKYLPESIYTRSGSGHDAALILESLQGTEFDLVTALSKWNSKL